MFTNLTDDEIRIYLEEDDLTKLNNEGLIKNGIIKILIYKPIEKDKCPDCGKELEDTYDVKDNYKVGEDPRIYGVICVNCGYEKYEK